MSSLSRRHRLLRAAEKVFAEKGFDRATMRNVAEEAEVGHPLVAHHFGTKLNLYRSVFEEYQHWNEGRLTALRKVDLTDADALERVVSAFLIVSSRNPGDAQLRNYFRLVLREASDCHASERNIIEDLFDPVAREFIKALKIVMPNKSAEFYPWAYLFAVGTYTAVYVGKRESALVSGNHTSSERVLDYLHSFICAGIRYG